MEFPGCFLLGCVEIPGSFLLECVEIPVSSWGVWRFLFLFGVHGDSCFLLGLWRFMFLVGVCGDSWLFLVGCVKIPGCFLYLKRHMFYAEKHMPRRVCKLYNTFC